MRGHTYPDLAIRYGVELCADSCGEPGHRRGWVDDAGLIHWDPDREVRRSTLRRFLMLVYEAVHLGPPTGRMSPWTRAERIHGASVFASQKALEDLSIRLPAYLARQDKARVRALLGGAPSELRRSRVGRWAGLR